ncbi:hypothetical protein GCM10011583_16830 [Streptomyces camponoticapitis]|uniref:Uncharacterized protein n=1 Tax=Streptomyces camponoticapitis TaxID=1616125 RepID=A0ABQ2E159_9ACTN|nr:hypothetical protein [Streptomyces camponoticapitis]GGJ85804.1 hypothetical protein GCM10011583_16830 [Streptomyces camponoticapitis]
MDGFPAGIWPLEDGGEGGEQGTPTVRALGSPTRARRDAVAEEGEPMPVSLSSATAPSYAVRFADF